MTRLQSVLSSVLVLLVVIISAGALLLAGEEKAVHFLTPRGEDALVRGSGLYHLDPIELASEGLVWDAVNLFLAAPVLAAATWLARRGSLRGQLAVLGLSLYVAYVYLQYATMFALNVFFPVYVAAFALGLVNLFVGLARIDPVMVKAHVSQRFPRRLFIGFCFTLSAMLMMLWGKLIASILSSGRFPPELAGMVTLQTQAFDLGIVVPLAIASGVLLLKDHPLGYVLSALTLAFGFMMSITIPAWIAVPLLRQGKLNAMEAVPFLLLCGVGLVLAVLFFRNVDEQRAKA